MSRLGSVYFARGGRRRLLCVCHRDRRALLRERQAHDFNGDRHHHIGRQPSGLLPYCRLPMPEAGGVSAGIASVALEQSRRPR
jgi:hypothetical protein